MESRLNPPRAANGRGKRELGKQNNRKIILDAAKRTFAEMGYGAATVRDIIRATPLASGTFYNYFKSKEEVYQAIRDDAALAIRPRLKESRRHAHSVEGFICDSFLVFFEYIAQERQNFRFWRCGTETTQMRIDTPEIIAGFEELRIDIENAIAIGFFPPVDANYLMAAIVGVALEVAALMVKEPTPNPMAAAQFSSTLILQGLKALPHVASKQYEKNPA